MEATPDTKSLFVVNQSDVAVQASASSIILIQEASLGRTELAPDQREIASHRPQHAFGKHYRSNGSSRTSTCFAGESWARPSIGTVADSYDNALAETTNGLYKTECVRGPDAPAVWADVDELELATLSWVHWFNEDRLHSHCDDVPPAEFESAFYADRQTCPRPGWNPMT